MTIAKRVALVGGVLFITSLILFAQDSPSSQQPVASINGKVLTLNDFQAGESATLLQAQFQYYVTERKALDDAIDNRLLGDEAKKRNITVDQLLETEAYKNVKDPTEDQLEVYYEGLDTQEPYSSVRGQVLDHIRELRRSKARAAYVEQLRRQAHIQVLLMPPTADVNTKNDYVLGDKKAPVVLVEFADYQCPYCQKVAPQIQQLKKEFGPELTLIYKDFPLPMHPNSEKAAEAARCAGDQGKFWEYHDVLFSSQELRPDELKQHARTLNLDTKSFDACLDNGTEAPAVKKELQEAQDLGLTGTPSFFVNNHFFSGVVDYAALKEIINQQLNVEGAKQQMLSKK